MRKEYLETVNNIYEYVKSLSEKYKEEREEDKKRLLIDKIVSFVKEISTKEEIKKMLAENKEHILLFSHKHLGYEDRVYISSEGIKASHLPINKKAIFNIERSVNKGELEIIIGKHTLDLLENLNKELEKYKTYLTKHL